MTTARFRRLGSALGAVAMAATAAVPVGAMLDAEPAGAAATTFNQVAADNLGGAAQHQSVADNVQAGWANTVVSVFQVARATAGCSCGLNMGWATSKDGGATWTSGTMPGLTSASSPPNPKYARVTDTAVAYDASHGRWLAVGAVYDAANHQVAATVNRATDGTDWGNAIVAVLGNGTTNEPDKTWIACNNFAGTPNYGHCYVTYTNIGDAGNVVGAVVSKDGGLTWSSPVLSGTMYDSVPAPLPNGQVAVVGTNGSIGSAGTPNGKLRAAKLSDASGTLTWASAPANVADITTHRPATMRALSKPSVVVDRGTGRVFAAYHDCRFRAGCSQNDLVLTWSDNGTAWTPVVKVDVDPPGIANIDHFDAGIGLDPKTSGASARLGIVFFYYPEATCTSNCAIHTGLSTSADGGASWSRFTTVSPTPTNSAWLVQATQGRYLTDYNSVVFPSTGSAPASTMVTAVPWATTAPDAGTLAQHLFAVTSPATIAPSATAPGAPGAVTAAGFDSGAVVAFAPPAGDGGSPVTSYTVVASPGGAVTAATASPVTVRGLANGTTYSFTVSATNTVGTGPASAPSNAVVPTAGVAPPMIGPGQSPIVVLPADAGPPGYWLVGADGRVYPFGGAHDFGPATHDAGVGTSVAVGLASTPDHAGLWIAGADGSVVPLGSAPNFGSMLGTPLSRPVVGIAATPTGQGYWLVASDGGIFSFGDAVFFGSTGAIRLNQPIVGMAASPSGRGYWLVASDGGIFSFGDAVFLGSTGDIRLNKPVVGMWPTATGRGYWFVASDGGVFSYGDAMFYGSTGGITLNRPIVGMAGAPGGGGYWFVGDDGGIFAFGAVEFLGSLGGQSPPPRVVSMSAA